VSFFSFLFLDFEGAALSIAVAATSLELVGPPL
jgi:hypothetical protein